MPKGLLLVTMEPPAAFEEEFNDWYDTEHFPQRRGLPGFETASRWVCLSGWPRWLALYDLSSPEALKTPEYGAVSGENSTPWSRRILPRTIGRLRIVAEQVEPGEALSRPLVDVARLCLAHYPAIAPAEAGLIQGAATSDSTGQVRVFKELGNGAGLWVIAELPEANPTEKIAAQFAALGEIRARLVNVYSPYWRS